MPGCWLCTYCQLDLEGMFKKAMRRWEKRAHLLLKISKMYPDWRRACDAVCPGQGSVHKLPFGGLEGVTFGWHQVSDWYVNVWTHDFRLESWGYLGNWMLGILWSLCSLISTGLGSVLACEVQGCGFNFWPRTPAMLGRWGGKHCLHIPSSMRHIMPWAPCV